MRKLAQPAVARISPRLRGRFSAQCFIRCLTDVGDLNIATRSASCAQRRSRHHGVPSVSDERLLKRIRDGAICVFVVSFLAHRPIDRRYQRSGRGEVSFRQLLRDYVFIVAAGLCAFAVAEAVDTGRAKSRVLSQLIFCLSAIRKYKSSAANTCHRIMSSFLNRPLIQS